MEDFILNALPFVITGIALAVICLNLSKMKTDKEETYLLEGMCLGMSFGVATSNIIPSLDISLSLPLGMLIGEAIGSYIKKK